MHELRRRQYLDALGIPSYVSRVSLPGAAPTRRLALRPERGERPSALADFPERPAKVHAPSVAPVRQREPVPPPAEQVDVPATAAPEAPAFSIAVFEAGGWLWLEELPGRLITQAQGQLVKAMAHAITGEAGQTSSAQFNWPLHKNIQLDLDEAAARAGLEGFVLRKIESGAYRGLVLMGEGCRRWLSAERLPLTPVINTVAALDMLENPALKRQAWQDLEPHRQPR